MTSTILITAKELAPKGMELLEASGFRCVFLDAAKGEDAMRSVLAAEPVDAIILRTLSLSGADMRNCPRLKVISRHGAGYNSVDVNTATALGVPVFIAPAANSQSVAELALGLILAVVRDIPWHDQAIKAGEWNRAKVGRQLEGSTLGLVGLGAIGRAVARMALAIGMTVRAFDRFIAADLVPKGVTLENALEDLLAQSDIVSLHCPLNESTRNLINQRTISLMRPDAFLINTARGELIDEDALADALDAGRPAGAALDTLANEPPAASNRLLKSPRIVVTPHVGGNTNGALDAVSEIAVRNALNFLTHKPVDERLCVNPDTLKQKVV
jgi:D-3-phosphoglycerate dehydrogenase / 2-oxoglutarate reductase